MNGKIYLDPKFLSLGSNICHNNTKRDGYGGVQFAEI